MERHPIRLLRSVKKIFQRIKKEEDFSSFTDQTPSKKDRLLRECERRNVSPYIDDPSENSSGIYALLRPVASEAELERRLNAARVVSMARCANIIALFAFLVSIVSLAKSCT